MKYLVAVSGGVDSVVLLDILAGEEIHDIIVAHFDHGIRQDSADDAQFVASLAKKYKLSFETKREVLGKNASEELARDRRYSFLREVSEKHGATIATGHHMNDIAETIAINVARGTGWRGVAVLASNIHRPLLATTKEEIMAYAKGNKLDWRDDNTNVSTKYLRNRLRLRISNEDTVLQLAALRARQLQLRNVIDQEVSHLINSGDGRYSRYFYTQIPDFVAIELLRGLSMYALSRSLTRPQLERTLIAIKTARAGTVFPFGSTQIQIDKKVFSLSVKSPQ